MQLATLESEVLTGDDWLHETKHDGNRALIAVGSSEARHFTRGGLDWSGKVPDPGASPKCSA